MKTKLVKLTNGKTITRYYPENDADVDTLNRMLKAGKLGAGPARKRVVQ